jgi:hypothetical protein
MERVGEWGEEGSEGKARLCVCVYVCVCMCVCVDGIGLIEEMEDWPCSGCVRLWPLAFLTHAILAPVPPALRLPGAGGASGRIPGRARAGSGASVHGVVARRSQRRQRKWQWQWQWWHEQRRWKRGGRGGRRCRRRGRRGRRKRIEMPGTADGGYRACRGGAGGGGGRGQLFCRLRLGLCLERPAEANKAGSAAGQGGGARSLWPASRAMSGPPSCFPGGGAGAEAEAGAVPGAFEPQVCGGDAAGDRPGRSGHGGRQGGESGSNRGGSGNGGGKRRRRSRAGRRWRCRDDGRDGCG